MSWMTNEKGNKSKITGSIFPLNKINILTMKIC